MRRSLLCLAVALSAASLSAQNPGPPTGRCQFQIDQLPSAHLTTIKLPSGQYNSYIGGGVVARCPRQKIVLKSDSLEQYGDEGRFFFIGHVDYTEPRMRLKSDFLTYFQKEERLLAFLNVDATLPSGSQLKGSSLEYFRAVPKVRVKQMGVAVGRPTISIIEKDPQGKAQPPVNVTGNTIWLQGDSVVSAQGEVVVVRPELTATGDSLYLDGGKGLLRVMRRPRINGTKGRPFTLVGETIDLNSRRRKLERVLSVNAAEATSQDLNLKSDTIDLRVSDDLLQRAIAWGKSRAHATSPTQTIVSDSIDVIMPGQRVREIHAIRQASADGAPDTTKFHTKEHDRLTGDTIVATFDTVPPKDTSAGPRIKTLTALGHATSYQHLAPRDTACKLPSINYVRGRIITVSFDSARVSRVEVREKEKGASDAVLAEPDETCGHPDAVKTPPGGAPRRPPANVPPASPPAANALIAPSARRS